MVWRCKFCDTAHHNDNCMKCRHKLCGRPRFEEPTPEEAEEREAKDLRKRQRADTKARAAQAKARTVEELEALIAAKEAHIARNIDHADQDPSLAAMVKTIVETVQDREDTDECWQQSRETLRAQAGCLS